MRILVIEDNPDISELLGYILNDDGHEVITSADDTSLDNLDKIMPDLILMDEILSGPRGSSLCRKLKNDVATRNIRVVLISAAPDLKELASKCGADAYIEKPFNIDTLTQVVKGLAVQ